MRNNFSELFRFCISGGVSVLTSYMAFVVSFRISSSIFVALIFSNLIHLTLNFNLMKRWVFKANGNNFLFKHLVVMLILILANYCLLRILQVWLVKVELIQFILLPCLALTSFILSKFWVFNSQLNNANKS